MPRTRKATQSGTSSSRGEKLHSEQFVTQQGEERFHRMKVRKKCILERGITIERPYMSNFGEIQDNIQNRGWGPFCASMTTCGIQSIVREFYANAIDCRGEAVYVRGKWVPFSATKINEVLHLSDIDPEQEDYRNFLRSNIDYKAVLNRICVEGAQWSMVDGQPRELPKNVIHKIPKAWMYFISAHLLPVKHFSSVTRDRALLLYAILEGQSIDVGRLIFLNICHIARETTTGGLGHPAVITALCDMAGVPINPLEPRIRAQSSIMGVIITAYHEPVVQADETSEPVVEPLAQPDPTESQVGQRLPPVEWWQHLSTSVHYLIQQNQHQMEYFAMRAEYEIAQMEAYSRVFNQIAANRDNPVTFPIPPPFIPFPVPPPQPYVFGQDTPEGDTANVLHH